MKRLWIRVGTLSIFLISLCVPTCMNGEAGQENLQPHRGAGACWRYVKDPKTNMELIKFFPSTQRCGWGTFQAKNHDTSGSPIGYNGYIKIVNNKNPKKAFYLGSFITQISLPFGKDSAMACYICTPENTNCSPNDPLRAAECFIGIDKITCDRQVDCSRVIDVTECYVKPEGPFSQVPNKLGLCAECDRGLLDFGPGGDYWARDSVSSLYDDMPPVCPPQPKAPAKVTPPITPAPPVTPANLAMPPAPVQPAAPGA